MRLWLVWPVVRRVALGLGHNNDNLFFRHSRRPRNGFPLPGVQRSMLVPGSYLMLKNVVMFYSYELRRCTEVTSLLDWRDLRVLAYTLFSSEDTFAIDDCQSSKPLSAILRSGVSGYCSFPVGVDYFLSRIGSVFIDIFFCLQIVGFWIACGKFINCISSQIYLSYIKYTVQSYHIGIVFTRFLHVCFESDNYVICLAKIYSRRFVEYENLL